MEGAGSLWNANSWHWEEKNYNKWAHEVIKRNLPSVKVDDMSITKVTKVKGEASINIRKGKQIFLFEFEIDCNWKNESGIDGTLKIMEFDQNDLDDIQIKVTVTQDTPDGNAARQKLMRQGVKVLEEFFTTFYKEMKKQEEERLEADRKAREEAKETTQKAVEERGAEKEEMLAASRPQVVERPNVEEVKGSEWNTGNYFWEERKIPWANEKLKELINATDFMMPGGTVTLKKVTAEGDSSYSVRKGKKIVTYQYEITIEWECALKDGDCNVLDSGTGTYSMPEFCMDEEYDIRVSTTSRNPIIKGYMDTYGKQAVTDQLKKFVEELKTAS